MLGSVKASPYGVRVAHTLSRELATAGRTVVSSGAPGIAGAVLRGALAADRPAVVVPSGGVVRPRPVQHSRLFGRVTYRGVVVSRSADHSGDRDSRFNRQSRLLAAAASAVVLIEPERGTLASAVADRVTQLRGTVFAVPGLVLTRSVEYPSSEFAHHLIRDDVARLVRGANDVLADLAGGGR